MTVDVLTNLIFTFWRWITVELVDDDGVWHVFHPHVLVAHGSHVAGASLQCNTGKKIMETMFLNIEFQILQKSVSIDSQVLLHRVQYNFMIYEFLFNKVTMHWCTKMRLEWNYLPCFDSEAVGCVPNEGVIKHNLFDHAGGVVLPEATYAVKQQSKEVINECISVGTMFHLQQKTISWISQCSEFDEVAKITIPTLSISC